MYGILGTQLLITALFCLLPFLSFEVRRFFVTQYWLAIVCGVIGLMLACTLFCVRSIARKVPLNYYLMLGFTACEAYTVAFICAVIGDREVVL